MFLITGGKGVVRLKQLSRLLVASLALASSFSAGVPALAKVTQVHSVTQKRIEVDGKLFAHPYSFVHNSTTYMPIWYMMQLLDTLHIGNKWNGVAKGWFMMAPHVSLSRAIGISHHNTGIYLNGKLVGDAPTVVYHYPGSNEFTTFMPIVSIIRVLNLLDIHSTWKNGTWNLVIPTSLSGSDSSKVPMGGSTNKGVATGLQSGSSQPGGMGTEAPAAPGSGGSSSGTIPSSVPQPSIVQQGGALTIDGQSVPSVSLSNHAQSDQFMWNRAGSDLYVSAQTNDPLGSESGASILAAQPGQTLYLFAYKNNSNLENSTTTWSVNSSEATITPGGGIWSRGNYNVVEADFSARQPGIYTVQAEDHGDYSVPLVIIVGQRQLQSRPFSVPQALTGILPLPTGMVQPQVQTQVQTQDHVAYYPYSAMSDWIPVLGRTTLRLSSITVALQGVNQTSAIWDYRIPVVNGKFSALLRSPLMGDVQVSLFPNYLKTMTHTADINATEFSLPNSTYTIHVNGPAPSTLQAALLPSSQGDYNISSRFSQIAATLLENSPSVDTGIAAISNFVSETIVYNNAEAAFNSKGYAPNYLYQDNLSSLNSKSGICEDYATLSASLLQSVGIPAQLLAGSANGDWTSPPATDANAAEAHQWLQAWNGSAWIVMDPTWNDQSSGNTDTMISSEFMTSTVSFQATHLLLPAQTNVPVAKSHVTPIRSVPS